MVSDVNEELIKFIIKVTGLERELIIKVLKAERKYYLGSLIEDED